MAIQLPRLMRFVVMLVVLLSATPAFACPQCALNDKAGLGSWFVLAGMITLPFFVVGGVLVAFRKLSVLDVEVDSQ